MKKRTLKNVAPAQTAVAEYKPEPRFVFRVSVHEQHYLRVGDVFEFAGRDHVVTSINECCARIVPVTEGTLVKTVFKPRFSETPVEFLKPEQNRALSVSANSEVKLLHRLGRNWKERISGAYPDGTSGVTKQTLGRHIKVALPVTSREVREHSPASPIIKRGRGRPRKCPICKGGHPVGCCAQDGHGG